jgi:cytochrome b561
MKMRSGQFTATAKWLHWLVAFFLASLMSEAFGFAWRAPEDRGAAVAVHVAIGLIVLAMMLVRLAVRKAWPPPPVPAGTPRWMVLGAKLGHGLLYGLFLALAVVGLWMAALSPIDIRVFSGISVSTLADPNPGMLARLRELHFAGAVLFVAVLFGHVAGALWHHVLLKDDVLVRMLPFSGYAQRVLDKGAPARWRFPSSNNVDWHRPETWFR